MGGPNWTGEKGGALPARQQAVARVVLKAEGKITLPASGTPASSEHWRPGGCSAQRAHCTVCHVRRVCVCWRGGGGAVCSVQNTQCAGQRQHVRCNVQSARLEVRGARSVKRAMSPSPPARPQYTILMRVWGWSPAFLEATSRRARNGGGVGAWHMCPHLGPVITGSMALDRTDFEQKPQRRRPHRLQVGGFRNCPKGQNMPFSFPVYGATAVVYRPPGIG